jgi:hypothetical protein
VHLASRISPDVVALHLTDLEGPEADEQEARLRGEWARFVQDPAVVAGLPRPVLMIEPSPYRSVLAPLLRSVLSLQESHPGRPVMVVLAEMVGGRWWETMMHTQRARRLRGQLLRHGGPDVAVLVVPWQLAAPDTAQVLAEEEPAAG